jgi:hypothetical protein
MSSLRKQVAIYEMMLIKQALLAHNQNRRQAARALGISLRTLFYKLRGVETPPVQHSSRTYSNPAAAGLFERHFPSKHPCSTPERDPRAVLLDDWWPGKLDVQCAHCRKVLPVEKGTMLTGGEYSTVIPNSCPFCGKQTFVTAP